MGRSNLRRLGKTAEVEDWGSGVVGGREPTKPRRAFIGVEGGWVRRKRMRRGAGNEAEVKLAVTSLDIIRRELTAPDLTSNVRVLVHNYSCTERKPSCISSQKAKSTLQKTYKSHRALSNPMCSCNSSNPTGEKCKTTTEKGAASRRLQI